MPTLSFLGQYGDGLSANPNPVVTGTLSPTGNRIILVFATRKSGGASPRTVDAVSSTFSVTGAGWAELQDRAGGSKINTALWWATTAATPGSGTVSVTFSGGGTGPLVHVYEVSGFHATTPIVQSANNIGTASTLTVTLGSGPASTSLVVAGVATQDVTSSTNITPGSGWTESQETGHNGATQNVRLQVQYDDTTPAQTPNWSGLGTTSNVGVAVEVAAVVTTTTVTQDAPAAASASAYSAFIPGLPRIISQDAPALAAATVYLATIPGLPRTVVQDAPASASALALSSQQAITDRFDDLGAWQILTSGNGTVTVSDNICTISPGGTAVDDAAAIWRPVNWTRNCILEITLDGEALASFAVELLIVEPGLTASPAIGDWIFRLLNPGDPSPVLRQYRDAGAQFWNAGAWGTSFTTWGDCVTEPGDYYTFIIERDADNGQTRFGLISKRENTGTLQQDQGWKLLDVTDWLPDSDFTTKGTDVKGILIGKRDTGTALASDGDIRVAAFRYSEQERVHVWGNERQGVATGSFNIKKWDGFRDASGVVSFFMPEDALPVVTAHKDPCVVLDGGTYYLTYNDESGNIVQRTASDPYGTWSAPSTLVTLASTGYDSGPGFPQIYYDQNFEGGKWIMIAKYGEITAEPYEEGKLVLFSASSPAGSWTQEGVILVGSNANDWEETGPGGHYLIVYNGTYYVFYQSQNDTSKLNQVGLAYGADLFDLTKSGNNPVIATETGSTLLNGAVSNTATITVDSTSIFSADQLIVIVNGPTDDDYSIHRIRKVLSGTQLELYEAVDTAPDNTPVRAFDQLITTPRFAEQQGGVWYLYGTKYGGGYVTDVYLESMGVFSCSDADPDSTNWGPDYFRTGRPPTMAGSLATRRSNENFCFINPALGLVNFIVKQDAPCAATATAYDGVADAGAVVSVTQDAPAVATATAYDAALALGAVVPVQDAPALAAAVAYDGTASTGATVVAQDAPALGAATAYDGQGTTLETGLLHEWPLDEASGTRNDLVGGVHLTDENTVTQAAGKVSEAAQFVRANDESLDEPTLGDIQVSGSFTVEVWIYLDQIVRQTICGRYGNNLTNWEWLLQGHNTLGPRLVVSDGATTSDVSWGAISTDQWYQVIAWHDDVAGEIGISVNDGTPVTAAWANSINYPSVPSKFRVGRGTGAADDPFDGRIDNVRIYDRVLPANERTALYASGKGRNHSELGYGQREVQDAPGAAVASAFDGETGIVVAQDQPCAASASAYDGTVAVGAVTTSQDAPALATVAAYDAVVTQGVLVLQDAPAAAVSTAFDAALSAGAVSLSQDAPAAAAAVAYDATAQVGAVTPVQDQPAQATAQALDAGVTQGGFAAQDAPSVASAQAYDGAVSVGPVSVAQDAPALATTSALDATAGAITAVTQDAPAQATATAYDATLSTLVALAQDAPAAASVQAYDGVAVPGAVSVAQDAVAVAVAAVLDATAGLITTLYQDAPAQAVATALDAAQALRTARQDRPALASSSAFQGTVVVGGVSIAQDAPALAVATVFTGNGIAASLATAITAVASGTPPDLSLSAGSPPSMTISEGD